MAQWYAHLLFKGDEFLGEGLDDFDKVSAVQEGIEGEQYTAIVVSGYALNGKLRGFYSLGVSQILVDPSTQQAYFGTEESSLHTESVETLTQAQKTATRDWLIEFDESAWEDSTEPFKLSLSSNGSAAKGKS